MKRTISLLACLLFVALQAVNAQSRTITGNVTSSDDGLGLTGVSVALKGTTTGTITDMDGNYSIEVSGSDAILVFSFVGMGTQEIQAGSSTVIDVEMLALDVALDEVVVTALGISREKKALGYSVQDVKGEELAESGDVNVLNSLAGRVAGISTTSATGSMGGSTRILIMGANSVTGNNSPLFVVDGIPFDNSEFNSYDTQRGAGGYDYGSMIQDLEPNDIESISVLKGPSAAAIYGSRAANGVILITTKKGQSRKGIGVSVNSSMAIEQVALLPKYQNTYGGGGENWFGGSEFLPRKSSTGWSTMWWTSVWTKAGVPNTMGKWPCTGTASTSGIRRITWCPESGKHPSPMSSTSSRQG
jgi:TonB-dependent SusC/RagA subfamily outer membrane receptor